MLSAYLWLWGLLLSITHLDIIWDVVVGFSDDMRHPSPPSLPSLSPSQIFQTNEAEEKYIIKKCKLHNAQGQKIN